MFRVKSKYTDNPNLVTLVGGIAVGLNGEVRVTIRPTKSGPGFERVARKATQHDLRILFEEGNPIIERVERQLEAHVGEVKAQVETTEPEPVKEKRKKEKQDG